MPTNAGFQRTPRWRSRSLQRAILLAALLAAEISPVKAVELWDFIQLGKNYSTGVKWETRTGKARVELRGDHVEIRAYYATDAEGEAADRTDNAAITFSGTIGSDHTVNARCIFLNTDAKPLQLSGQYITRSESQIWGEKRKIVTFYEIVFPHPPNRDFFGFLGTDVRDE